MSAAPLHKDDFAYNIKRCFTGAAAIWLKSSQSEFGDKPNRTIFLFLTIDVELEDIIWTGVKKHIIKNTFNFLNFFIEY